MSGIGHGDPDVGASHNLASLDRRIRCVQLHELRRKRERAVSWHRIAGINGHVQQRILQPRGVDLRRWEVPRELRGDPDIRSQRAWQHL